MLYAIIALGFVLIQGLGRFHFAQGIMVVFARSRWSALKSCVIGSARAISRIHALHHRGVMFVIAFWSSGVLAHGHQPTSSVMATFGLTIC